MKETYTRAELKDLIREALANRRTGEYPPEHMLREFFRGDHPSGGGDEYKNTSHYHREKALLHRLAAGQLEGLINRHLHWVDFGGYKSVPFKKAEELHNAHKEAIKKHNDVADRMDADPGGNHQLHSLLADRESDHANKLGRDFDENYHPNNKEVRKRFSIYNQTYPAGHIVHAHKQFKKMHEKNAYKYLSAMALAKKSGSTGLYNRYSTLRDREREAESEHGTAIYRIHHNKFHNISPDEKIRGTSGRDLSKQAMNTSNRTRDREKRDLDEVNNHPLLKDEHRRIMKTVENENR